MISDVGLFAIIELVDEVDPTAGTAGEALVDVGVNTMLRPIVFGEPGSSDFANEVTVETSLMIDA